MVIPTQEVADPIAIEEGVDKPSAVADLVACLTEAGFRAAVVHANGDLAIITARS